MSIKKILALSFFFYFLTLSVLFLYLLKPASTQLIVSPHTLPDLATLEDIQERKDRFLTLLDPLINIANAKINQERDQIIKIEARFLQDSLSPKNRRELAILTRKYEVKETELALKIEKLKLRINVIPKALVLVQAANESAWGTSRFALTANNLFGQWCFSKGCGIVPNNRAPGARHEVQKFPNLLAAIESYMLNINTHDAYRELRTIRAKQNAASALQLVEGLESYSERGEDYIRELKQMIRFNNLE